MSVAGFQQNLIYKTGNELDWFHVRHFADPDLKLQISSKHTLAAHCQKIFIFFSSERLLIFIVISLTHGLFRSVLLISKYLGLYPFVFPY